MISLVRKARRRQQSSPPAPSPCEHQVSAESFRSHAHPDTAANSEDSAKQRSGDGPLDAGAVAPVPVDAKGKCVACRAEKSATRKYRWRVIGGLILPFGLQALDVTM